MKKILWLMLAIGSLVAACGGTDDEAAGGTTTTAGAATTLPCLSDACVVPSTSPPGRHALVLRAIDFDAGLVEIANTGLEAFDLAGHWLCGQFNYEPLAETIAPGTSLMVSLDGLGIEASDGELGLYKPLGAQTFSSPDRIIRYVEWGSSGHGRSGVAVTAGVWTDGDFVSGGGANLSSSGDDPIAARDWTSG